MVRSKALYFIAIVPDEPVYAEVLRLKEEVNKRFDSRAALRSPPHITLHMPFQWQPEKEARLTASLDKLAATHTPFDIDLDGFGAFPPRVIYVQVAENEALRDLQNAVQKHARTSWHIYPQRDSRPFRPHMTIAFRDLKKAIFPQAWAAFEQRPFSGNFQVHDLCLLKHNGKNWDICHRSVLQG